MTAKVLAVPLEFYWAVTDVENEKTAEIIREFLGGMKYLPPPSAAEERRPKRNMRPSAFRA